MLLLFLLTLLLASSAAAARQGPDASQADREIALRECLVIPSVGRSGRNPLHQDAVEARIVAGRWTPPEAGDEVELPGGAVRTWEPAAAGADGWLNHRALSGGYAYWRVEAPAERVAILEAAGHNLVYVNGEPRMGDPYRTETVGLPVLLRRGRNDFLFQCGRRSLKARLVEPSAPLFLDTRDSTLPDLVLGERESPWAAVVVANATREAQSGLSIRAERQGARAVTTPLPPIPPLTVRKVGFRLGGPSPKQPGEVEVRLTLLKGSGRGSERQHAAAVTVRARRPDEVHKRTFISGIDGSVQYYAVNPARPLPGDTAPPALFLSLHGAAVEAVGQAAAYSSKSWGHLVAPTNRRPYGFDWEDWGRLDALEVLEEAQRRLKTDPRRVYLTGHSMGGHGTWHVGVTFPGRFAAIGPSAGWVSFWSYAGSSRPREPDAMEQMLLRAASPSDTLSLAPNLEGLGVYVLHGGADDNVPAREARTMEARLKEFHRDFVYHEEPGQGHWWDLSPEPGADCVDWAPLFDHFARRRLPENEAARQVRFRTASPGVSAWRDWAGIEAQQRPLVLSSVVLRYDPELRRFSGVTENVARLALRLDHVRPGGPITLELDGGKLEGVQPPEGAKVLHLARSGGSWRVIEAPSPRMKGPHRYGPFKDAFRNRVLFVYGTQGTAEENAWAYAKARYDAETLWVRGNGSVDVIPDTAFRADEERDRGVILYGNADTNAAWQPLLGESPVQVRRGSARLGDREVRGDDLACLFLRPRPGSDMACVGVVSGTGPAGFRLTDRMPYFVAGVAYPDCILLGPETLSEGAAGVRAAGFFGLDWGLSTGDFVWR